uniref:Candidate secreted effector n=1 Tax=Meloidogyne incognita TaxID=6306 RepID=A0A914NPB9_MELIC
MSKFISFLLIGVFVYIQLCDCGKTDKEKVVSDDDKGDKVVGDKKGKGLLGVKGGSISKGKPKLENSKWKIIHESIPKKEDKEMASLLGMLNVKDKQPKDKQPENKKPEDNQPEDMQSDTD